MPKTKWLTGDELRVDGPTETEAEKLRRWNREQRARARGRDRAITPNVQAIPTCDSGNSMGRCRVCGERIGFTTDNGLLIPLDWGSLNSHRHKNG